MPNTSKAAPWSLPAGPLTGVLLLSLAVLLFAAGNTVTRDMALLYGVPLVMLVRYAVQLLLVIVIFGPRQGRRLYQTRRTGLVLLRGSCLAVGSMFFVFALQRIPVPETTAIAFLAPMIVVLVARPILGETIGVLGWFAAALGFAGVLLIVRPGSGIDPVGVALVGVSVGAIVIYQMLSRALIGTETTSAMLLYSALAGTVLFGLVTPFWLGGPVPTPEHFALFVIIGAMSGFGHFLLTTAYRHAPASLLAPVNYLELVWAALIGWLLYNRVPDPLTAAGMAVVAISGIIAAVRSSRMPREKPVVPVHEV